MLRIPHRLLLACACLVVLAPACFPESETPIDPGPTTTAPTTSTTGATTTTTAPEPGGAPRGFGGLPEPVVTGGGPSTTLAPTPPPTPPASADLTGNAGPALDQGDVGSCTSFALAALMRWKTMSLGMGAIDFAPQFVYSQVHAYDLTTDLPGGSRISTSLEVMRTQGIPPARNYFQGYLNWRDQPTAAERDIAQDYRVLSYQSVMRPGPDKLAYLKDALAKGNPVVLGILPTDGFSDMMFRHLPTDVMTDTTSFVRTNPGLATHTVLALGYDSSGLIIQNSWGSGFGYSSGSVTGLAKLGWNYVASDLVGAAFTVGGVQIDGPPIAADIAALEITAVTPAPGASSVYRVDGTGGTWGNYFSPISNQWSGWFPLGTNHVFPGARIEAVADGTGAVDLTIQAGTGEYYHGRHEPGADNRGRPGQPPEVNRWTGWTLNYNVVTPPGGSPTNVADRAFPQGQPLSAISVRPGEASVYAQDETGRVWTQYRSAGRTAWSQWFPLGTKTFATGARVAAVGPRVGETSLYVLDSSGRLWQDYFLAGGSGWSDWHEVPTGVLPTFPFSKPKVTAISVRPGETSVYAVSLDGRVHTTYFLAGATSWSGWFPLGSNTFPIGSAVSATTTGPGVTGLYVLGSDRQVWSQFYDPASGTGWSGWFGLGDGTFIAGEEINAFSTGPGATTLHVRDNRGDDRSSYYPTGGPAWIPWFTLA